MWSTPDEQRDFYRVALDCAVVFRTPASAADHNGKLKDHRGGGLQFVAGSRLEAGSQLVFTVTPDNDITAPLCAEAVVLRTSAHAGGGWMTAARIVKVIASD